MFDSAEWNAAVEALGGSIAQSWEWGLLHEREGWKPLRLLHEERRGAVQLLFRSSPRGGSVAYAPYGPLAASTSELAEITESVAHWARRRRAYLLKMEPRWSAMVNSELLGRGQRYVEADIELPASTLILAVPKDPEEHLKALPQDARYRVRRARREGVEVLTLSNGSPDMGDKMAEFLQLLRTTTERHGFYMAPEEFYRNVMRDLPAHLLLAYHEGTPLAAAIVAIFGEEAYYLFGASTSEKGSLRAPYLLQWEAMEVARRAGCSRYDMWGIPRRSSARSEGFVQFKKKFGGTLVEYPAAYFRILSYPQVLKYGTPSLVARGTGIAIRTIRSYPGARKVYGKVSVKRDTGEPPEEQAGGRNQSAGRRRWSVKNLSTLGIYYITTDAYARAFASGEQARVFGKPVAGPPAPFIGGRVASPPNAIAAHRQGSRS